MKLSLLRRGRAVFGLWIVVGLLSFPSVMFGVEPSADAAVVAEKIRDIRARAAKWEWVRVKMDLIFAVGSGTEHLEGDGFWRAPDQMGVFLRSEGRKTLEYAYVWDSEVYSRYRVDESELVKINVRTLKPKFTPETLARAGLVQQADPFQGVRENSIRYLGEEQFNGEKTFLFEGIELPQYGEEETGPLRSLLWIGVEDGLLRRSETYLADGSRLMSQTVSIEEKRGDKNPSFEFPELKGDFTLKEDTAEAEQWLEAVYGRANSKRPPRSRP